MDTLKVVPQSEGHIRNWIHTAAPKLLIHRLHFDVMLPQPVSEIQIQVLQIVF
jgi:hypothetical protein